jgi:ATP-dependent protease Clp ATPase subunit
VTPPTRSSLTPTCGMSSGGERKTHLASYLNVPLAIGDAISLTEARTWSPSSSSCSRQPRAMGIVNIDEVDKLRRLGVQHAQGTVATVPP